MRRSTLTSFAFALLLGGVLSGCPSPAESSGSTPAPSETSTSSRLSGEGSPYLLQHADNAVDWYAWGEEAFQKARREEKPIFLSIGYSTCHWCHVMEEESFMNETVGNYLNEHFVPIKVDRETRPDVDAVYMSYVQRNTGSGGWPLSVFLAPDGTPFYGGTYFPHPAKYGRVGFLELLQKIEGAWDTKREEILSGSSAFLQSATKEQSFYRSEGVPPETVLGKAVEQWESRFDSQYGGFGTGTKFPSPPELEFLLRYGVSEKHEKAQEMVLKTLRAIALGGIRDHLAGGFHRYSVDREWLVPHFEKMLYDQAQLVKLYSQAYALTGEELYRDAAVSTLGYLQEQMRSEQGGYFSAEDADSSLPEDPARHAEGAFYVWTWEELQAALSPEEFESAQALLGFTEEGNAAENDPQGELKGKNVLSLSRAEVSGAERELLNKLRELRKKRPRPHLDAKVLTEWNALLAGAYSAAGRYLRNPEYLQESARLLAFLEEHSVVDEMLHRSLFEGRAGGRGFAADYTQLVAAYLAHFQATGEPKSLERALFWQGRLDQDFWDRDAGGYFSTLAESELVYRPKSWQDGAVPAVNSVAASNLQTLFALTGEEEFEKKLLALFKASGTIAERSPTAVPGSLSALHAHYGRNRSLMVLSTSSDWKSAVTSRFQPDLVLLPVVSAQAREQLAGRVKHLPEWPGRSSAYFCQDFHCELPKYKLEEVTGKL